MCFKTKMKQPKVDTKIPAPEPVLLDAPEGVSYGDSVADDYEAGSDGLRVEKSDMPKLGEGSQTATATDTGSSTVKTKKTGTAAIKRAMTGKKK